MTLFDQLPQEAPKEQASMPLAARMRPRNFEEYVGQEHIVGPDKVLRKSIEADRLGSIILWGPPGSGKTTLAEVVAKVTACSFQSLSAVTAGVADLRRVVEDARQLRRATGRRSILFVDEIHRFNKAQQDAILPHVETGVIILIGATTENPSFEVNSALLSRCRVYTLHALSDAEIEAIVQRALVDTERGLGTMRANLDTEAREHLVGMANGDARVALNALEMAVMAAESGEDGNRHIDLSAIEDALQRRVLHYDKSGEQHYDIISALHKSLRGSDPDASLYWLGRMLEAGEDPLYIARRLIRCASEDIGMADPRALQIAIAAQQAVHFLGMPEGNLALVQATVYLATAPKSNALYAGYSQVQKDINQTRNEPVPLHLRNAVTGLMKGLGYGRGYRYAHDYEGNYVEQQNLPDSLRGRKYYQPTENGYERNIKERLALWRGKTQPAKKKTEREVR